jgi:hypothetical protein
VALTSDNKPCKWCVYSSNSFTSDKWRREGNVHFSVHSICDWPKDNPSQTVLSLNRAVVAWCGLVIAVAVAPSVFSLLTKLAP